jgi:TldD protein
MLDLDLAVHAVAVAGDLGASYCEARIQQVKGLEAILRNGEIQPGGISDSYGIGIRVVVNGALSFGAANKLERGAVSELCQRVVKNAKAAGELVKDKVSFTGEEGASSSWNAVEKKNMDDVSFDELISLLREVDSRIKNGWNDVKFPSRLLVVESSVEEKAYCNSNGAGLRSRVPRFSFYSILTAIKNGKAETVSIPAGYSQLGGTGGFELPDELKLYDYVSREGENLATVLRSEGSPPRDTVDVVLGPVVSGLVAHESCGHPSEADRILGREAAQAGESYITSDKVGTRIGSEEACVSDDPTLPGSMGFYLYDDEGVQARRRRLLYKGMISELLHNRATAHQFHVQSNGSSRAVWFGVEPIIRMGNTFIEPGDYSFEELVEDVEQGVYIKSYMEWNIDDRRLNQRYVGLEAYLIENGKITRPVRNPVLEVSTPKLWGSLDARAKDLQFTCGTCGKGDPMQGAPVWLGGPHIRLRNLKLGGR